MVTGLIPLRLCSVGQQVAQAAIHPETLWHASMDAKSNTVLADQIRRGEAVVSAATFVGDRDDLDLWRRKRATWASEAINLLRNQLDAETLHAFERAVSQPPTVGDLHEDLPVEIQSLREAVGALRSAVGD